MTCMTCQTKDIQASSQSYTASNVVLYSIVIFAGNNPRLAARALLGPAHDRAEKEEKGTFRQSRLCIRSTLLVCS